MRRALRGHRRHRTGRLRQPIRELRDQEPRDRRRYRRFRPQAVAWRDEQLQSLPGLCVHDIMLLPIERLQSLFADIELAGAAGRGNRPADDRDPRAAEVPVAMSGSTT